MKAQVFRPTLDDVERLSLGKGARKRGTGSRYVPHRLNQDERNIYARAKQDNYLIVKGTAYRRERKGSPVCNTFRQRCDALGQICIIIEKRGCGCRVKIDLSTLRVRDDSVFVSHIWNLLAGRYPSLIEEAEDHCTNAKIDWSEVQNNAIWGVVERLLTIACSDSATAKSVAEEILQESLHFGEEARQINSQQAFNVNKGQMKQLSKNDEHDNDAGSEIDWNDI